MADDQYVACGNYTNRDWIKIGKLSVYNGKEIYPGASLLELFGRMPAWSNKYTISDSVTLQGMTMDEQEAHAFSENSRLAKSSEIIGFIQEKVFQTSLNNIAKSKGNLIDGSNGLRFTACTDDSDNNKKKWCVINIV